MKPSLLFFAIAAALAAAADSFIKSGREAEANGDDSVFLNGTGTGADTSGVITITPEQISNEARDSSGLPYDARIHAETRGVNKDGTWKRRRNVSDEIVDAVTAELRATVGTAAPAPAPAPVVAAVIPPPPVAAVQIPLPVVAAPVANDYTKLCDFLAKNTGEGTAMNDEWVKAWLAANATTLPDLAADAPRAGRLLESLRATLAASNIAEVV